MSSSGFYDDYENTETNRIMMSSRDLVNNLLNGKPVDRVGIYDHGPWSETYRRWIQQGYPTVARKSDDAEDKPSDPVPSEPVSLEPVPFVEHFKYDMYSVGGWISWEPLPNLSKVVEETNDSVIVRNGAGALIRNFKTRASTPEWIEFTMTNREIWEKDYRPHLLTLDASRVDITGTRERLARAKKQGYWTFYGGQFIWENMRNSMGNKVMLESLLTDPEWIHDYNRVYTDFYKKHYKLMIEECGLPDGIWLYEDLGYRNGLVCSPKTLREMIFPYYAEMVDFFRSYNLPVILHSDGRVDEAIPLIVESGFVGLNPVERKAGCDPFEYAREYGDSLTFIGCMDARVLESGDRPLIEKETVSLLRAMKNSGARFLFGIDHSVPPDVSYDDFRFMIDVYRQNMAY